MPEMMVAVIITVEIDTEKIGRAMLFGSSPVFSFCKRR